MNIICDHVEQVTFYERKPLKVTDDEVDGVEETDKQEKEERVKHGLKPFTEKEWKEFQEKVKRIKQRRNILGVNLFKLDFDFWKYKDGKIHLKSKQSQFDLVKFTNRFSSHSTSFCMTYRPPRGVRIGYIIK